MELRVHEIRTALQAQGFPLPSVPWTAALVANRNPLPPLASHVATAKARLLAADLAAPGVLDASVGKLPAGVSSAQVRSARLPQDVPVQVLDVENLSRSRWEQVEELEAVERGEQTKGREIVRLAPDAGENRERAADEQPDPSAAASLPNRQAAATAAAANSTHRIVFQDGAGQKVYGLELRRVPKIGVGLTNIGEKMVLKAGAAVSRGVVLLEPDKCVPLGGKVEAWQKTWLEGRLQRLRGAANAEN